MKKLTFIVILFGSLASCKTDNVIAETNQYVAELANREDLTWSITEFVTEAPDDEIVGGMDISTLTSEDRQIYRIISDVSQPNQNPLNYDFFYRKGSLIFAQVIRFNEEGTDTIVNSDYYYKGNELIKQVDRKNMNIESNVVKQESDYYLNLSKKELE